MEAGLEHRGEGRGRNPAVVLIQIFKLSPLSSQPYQLVKSRDVGPPRTGSLSPAHPIDTQMRQIQHSELPLMQHKPFLNHLCSVAGHIIPLLDDTA